MESELSPKPRVSYCDQIHNSGRRSRAASGVPVAVRSLSPYVPGEQPKLDGIVKLNTNEILTRLRLACSPQSPPQPIVCASTPIRARNQLREAIATRSSVALEQAFVGNGSDEVLAHTFQALLKHDAPLLFPDITYSFYPVDRRLYGVRYEEVPLDAAMRVQIADYRRPSSAILLSNPNAPTGIALSRDAIEALVAEHPDQLVVVDEAYVDFGAESAVPLVSRHDNLLVVQTFSKSRALAGLRVGFAIGQRPLIEALERVKDSFNSYPARLPRHRRRGRSHQRRGMVSGDAQTHHRQPRNADARPFRAGLRGFDRPANFVFARHRSRGGADLAARLRERGVLVRHFQHPRIENFLRITVGNAGPMQPLDCIGAELDLMPRAGAFPRPPLSLKSRARRRIRQRHPCRCSPASGPSRSG